MEEIHNSSAAVGDGGVPAPSRIAMVVIGGVVSAFALPALVAGIVLWINGSKPIAVTGFGSMILPTWVGPALTGAGALVGIIGASMLIVGIRASMRSHDGRRRLQRVGDVVDLFDI